jgi:hypothetical protein
MTEVLENGGFENEHTRFIEKVVDCLTTIWLTHRQIYDIYIRKNDPVSGNDGELFDDIHNVLEDLAKQKEILKEDDPRLGERYKLEGLNNILPFVRKGALV